MTVFEVSAILLTFAALGAWLNAKFLKLPTTIGVMAIAMAGSLIVLVVGQWQPTVTATAEQLLASIDFDEALLHGMLGFLLFAGALHVNLGDLWTHKLSITLLATAGVLVTTVLAAGAAFGVSHAVGVPIAWMHCLIFGALIAPTDPIAVLAILKKAGAPKPLEVTITGESLFNDGVGVVVFLALVSIAGFDPHAEHAPSAMGIAKLFVVEALGGAAFGAGVGLLGFVLLKKLNDYPTEILITLAMVTGGYAACDALHLSGPIAMVVAGLLIGNHGRALAMSEQTQRHLDLFWELIDEILNAVLFVLIGLEVLVIAFEWHALVGALVMIPATLAVRWLAVDTTLRVLRRPTGVRHASWVLTWGGLRGGISVALALSLRESMGEHHQADFEVILLITYVIVAFSILVQGLTVGPLLRRLKLTGTAPPQTGH